MDGDRRVTDKASIRFNDVGLRHVLRVASEEYSIWRRHRRGLRDATWYVRRAPLKLHLGCGDNLKSGWVNVDLNEPADLFLDLRRPMPFPNESVLAIYSEHFMEHLSYPDQAQRFLAECLRVIVPGGVFSVGVPDTEWPLRAYVKETEPEYFRLAKEKWHPKWCITKLEHINYHFRQLDEHKFAYDYETMKHALEAASFIGVMRRDFDPERDSLHRNPGTLYVDASKP